MPVSLRSAPTNDVIARPRPAAVRDRVMPRSGATWSRTACRVRRRRRRARRRPRRRPATTAAVPTRSPCSTSRTSCAARVSRRAHGTPRKTSRSGRVQSDAPPATVESSAPVPHRSGRARRARRRASAGVSWGVSMPTRSAGSPRSSYAPRAVRRGRRRAARACRTRRQPASGFVRRARGRAVHPAPRAPHRVCRRARPRRGRRPAAECTVGRAVSSPVPVTAPWRGPRGGVDGSSQHPAMSWTARTVPRTVPVTFDRPMRGDVGHGDLLDPPARVRRPQHHLERPAEPPVGDAELEQRLAPSGAHRAEVGAADPGPAPDESKASTRFATRACSGQRRDGRAAGAEHEIGWSVEAPVPHSEEIGSRRTSRRSP